MRIISKFKDYYDGALRHSGGGDKTIPLIRTNSMVKIEDLYCPAFTSDIEILPQSKKDYIGVSSGTVGFCGIEYPYIHLNYEKYVGKDDNGIYDVKEYSGKYIYNLESFKKETKNYSFKYYGRYTNDNEKIKEYVYNNVEKYLQRNHTYLNDYFKKLNTPYFHCNAGHDQHEIEIFPILKNLQFYRVVSIDIAYNQIEMFITNTLAPKDNPYVQPVPDEIKAESKGFDKWSFRKIGKKSKL